MVIGLLPRRLVEFVCCCSISSVGGLEVGAYRQTQTIIESKQQEGMSKLAKQLRQGLSIMLVALTRTCLDGGLVGIYDDLWRCRDEIQ